MIIRRERHIFNTIWLTVRAIILQFKKIVITLKHVANGCSYEDWGTSWAFTHWTDAARPRFSTCHSWRIETNLLKSVCLKNHWITKFSVRGKITLPAASSFKPKHPKSLTYMRTTHEPTWHRPYLPRAIKPAKRMSKFHLTAGCISARVVWRPSSLSSQSNFFGSLAGMSAMMESGVSTPVPSALLCRCAASWSDPNLTSVVPPLRAQSAPLAHPYGLHTGRGKPL